VRPKKHPSTHQITTATTLLPAVRKQLEEVARSHRVRISDVLREALMIGLADPRLAKRLRLLTA